MFVICMQGISGAGQGVDSATTADAWKGLLGSLKLRITRQDNIFLS